MNILKFIKPVYAQFQSGGNIDTQLQSRGGWSFENLGTLMEVLIQVAIIIAGILLLVFLIYGGISYITAAGDEEKVENAQLVITNALSGLVIVITAFAIVTILERVFGIKIISGITLPRP